MTTKMINRHIVEYNERKYYVYAESVSVASSVFRAAMGDAPKYISVDTDPWETKIEENWNANNGKALSPKDSTDALSVICPVCNAHTGLCCNINGLRRMHLAHSERVELLKKQMERA